MSVAALYDIHGNLPALESVLSEVKGLEVHRIVVGGDLAPGPMPRECLQMLLNLDMPVDFIYGNCDLAMVAIAEAKSDDEVGYWGTTGGGPLPERFRPDFRWSAQDVAPLVPVIKTWPMTLSLTIDGLGKVLFCHGTPRSELEIMTRITPAEKVLPLVEGLAESVIVCGHSHMQYDRMVGNKRVINSGSIGQPYGASGTHWLLLGPDIQLRRTNYDLESAAARIHATSYPGAEEFVQNLINPASEEDMHAVFTPWEVSG
ncbi:MAG: metallophosphoesterase family protein [Armatimonadetes bacterium]|nr:metallophosphoesterase family protein [Armatimonadota bacterium]